MGFFGNMLKDEDYDEDYEDDYEEGGKKKFKGKVVVVSPKSIDESEAICNHLLSGYTVVIKLIDLDSSISQRVIDFTAGACYCIQGNLQKITSQILIAAPKTTDLSGDFLAELGSRY